MSTHNIGFYEDLTKINFELSSNIIKYAPYFFYCCDFFCLLFSLMHHYLVFMRLYITSFVALSTYLNLPDDG